MSESRIARNTRRDAEKRGVWYVCLHKLESLWDKKGRAQRDAEKRGVSESQRAQRAQRTQRGCLHVQIPFQKINLHPMKVNVGHQNPIRVFPCPPCHPRFRQFCGWVLPCQNHRGRRGHRGHRGKRGGHRGRRGDRFLASVAWQVCLHKLESLWDKVLSESQRAQRTQRTQREEGRAQRAQRGSVFGIGGVAGLFAQTGKFVGQMYDHFCRVS